MILNEKFFFQFHEVCSGCLIILFCQIYCQNCFRYLLFLTSGYFHLFQERAHQQIEIDQMVLVSSRRQLAYHLDSVVKNEKYPQDPGKIWYVSLI